LVKVADADGSPGNLVSDREKLDDAIKVMFETKGPYLLEVNIEKEDNIFPMVPAGASVSDILLSPADAAK
jgi:acetolactate synthase I/II/III large subunit